MSFLSGMRLNNLGPGLLTTEIDNITDTLGIFDVSEQNDIFSQYTDPKKQNDGFIGAIGDFLRAATVGETFAAFDAGAKVDSWAGIAGSMVKSLVNPLDAVTDLTSGISIITRALQDGTFGIGTMFEAATYFGSAVPVLGAAVDLTRLNKAFSTAKSTVASIGDLNKGFSTAFDAAKANTKGLNIADDLLGGDLSKITKADYWNDLKNLTVKFKDGDTFKELSMTDALKQVRKKGYQNDSLEEAIKNTQKNFELKIGDKLKDLNAKDLIAQQKDFDTWKDLSDKKIQIDGTERSFKDLLETTDADELVKINTALKEYNRANKTSVSLEKLEKIKKGSDSWTDIKPSLDDLEIRVGDRVLGDSRKGLSSVDQYSMETRFHQKKLKEQGQILVEEGQKVLDKAKPAVQNGMYQVGRAANVVKENVFQPALRGFSGVA
ncbi:MAG: hypothetical protein EBR67_03695 [Proteobacteria bacterium]|nr:hypothetical protein [Pseudomonadota bacterium]